MFKKYIEYIKDNPEGYWFKRKLYGWGWTPATKQGWFVVALFVAFLVIQEILFEFYTGRTKTDSILFFAIVFFSVIGLILICKLTGQSPKWQWGRPKQDQQD